MADNDDIERMQREPEAEDRDDERIRNLDRLIRRARLLSNVLPIVFLCAAAVIVLPQQDLSLNGILFGRYGSIIAVGAGTLLVMQQVVRARMDDLASDRAILRARQRVQEHMTAGAPKEVAPATSLEVVPSAEDTYFNNLVTINVENLAAYYELVKIQTDKSFRASLTVAYFGASLIFTGLVLGFYRTDATDKMAYIAAGAGVVTEFIASVFFWLYSRTVRQLRGYHDSLLSVQNVLLSFKLVSDTRDPKEKAVMVSKMCSHLLARLPRGITPADDDERRHKSERKKTTRSTAAPNIGFDHQQT
jgi:hypothetical protein